VKNFFEHLVDFITGGFFSYVGAAVRILFVEEKFSSLVKDPMSNNIGMLVLTILLFGVVLYIKLSV
jgi:hypothetical protein